MGPVFNLICALLTVLNHQARSEANQSCDKRSCEFHLNDPEVARQQFTKIDHSKLWLVYFNLTTEKSEASGSGETEILTWANSSTSPFLSFDSGFEMYSFSMLTQSVIMINMQAKSEGSDPSRDCLKDLLPYCRNRTISKVLLNIVTDAKGVVCFGESPSRRCCESSGGDVKCGIEPRSGWRWIDIDYLSAIVGIAGYFFFPLLLCLLPSLPDSQNGIELTAPQAPSPLSFSNVFVKCFSNKPEHCFRDAFAAFCCRIAVLLGLLPSVFYLSTIAFLALRHKVFLISSTQDDKIFLFHNVGVYEICYYIFALLAVAMAIVPLVRYFLQQQPNDEPPARDNCRDNLRLRYCFSHHSYGECTKRFLKVGKVFLNSSLWNFLPLCYQDNRNISKICQIPVCYFCVLSPCLFILIGVCSSFIVCCFPGLVIVCYPIHTALIISSSRSKRFILLCICLSLCTLIAHIIMAVESAVFLMLFVTYTIIGFVLNYKLYLPLVSAVVLVISYIHQCYHTTNDSYDELRKLVFEVCIEQQSQLDSSVENNVIVNHQSQQEQHEELQGYEMRQRGHLTALDETPRKLVYINENTGSPLISKKLFENICWKLKPTGATFCGMVTKMVALTMFVLMVIIVVLTLTPQTEVGVLIQSAITLFVGNLPRVFFGSSNNTAQKGLQILETKKCIQHCVIKYLESGELSGEQFLRQEQQAIGWI